MAKQQSITTLHTELQQYVQAAKSNLVSACSNALKAGACVVALANTSGNTVGATINEIDFGDVSRRTIYRWANAYNTACKILALDHIPDRGLDEWDSHLTDLDGVAANMSISRLQLGAPAEGSDIARLDTLQTGVETAADGREEELYTQAIENVESGKWTLIAALRAIGGQQAAAVAIERRKDPLYIGIDDETKKPVGILPKAVSSLKTGLENWDAFDGEAKRAFAALWKDVLNNIPADLMKYL